MEAMKLQKRVPVSAMLDRKIVMPAIGSAIAKLDPRLMLKNPVMFVVEIVAALTTVIFIRDFMTGSESLGFTFQIILWLWFTVLFANFAEAVAEGRGKAQAEIAEENPYRKPGQAALRLRPDLPHGAWHQPESRRYRAGRGRRQHSFRWRGDRGRRFRQRGRHHRRIRACYPRIRWRPLGRDRRHPGAVGLDPCPHHGRPRVDLHRPHDQAGRGGRARRKLRTRSRSTSCSRASPSFSCSRL